MAQKRVSKFTQQVENIFSKPTISIGEILEQSSQGAFGILLIILSLPSALPIPAPGYSTPFGVVLLLLGLQIIAGKHTPWIPAKLRDKKMSLESKKGVFQKVQSLSGFFAKFVRPRLHFLYKGLFYRLYGVLIALCGISMIIPLPLTNTPPSFGIFLIGIGMVEEDGLFGIVGSLVCMAGVLLTLCILIFGVAAVKAAIGYIF